MNVSTKPTHDIIYFLPLFILAHVSSLVPQCGFFDRARPPQDDDVSDQEQLTAEKSTEA